VRYPEKICTIMLFFAVFLMPTMFFNLIFLCYWFGIGIAGF
jgi:hypothetical protein